MDNEASNPVPISRPETGISATLAKRIEEYHATQFIGRAPRYTESIRKEIRTVMSWTAPKNGPLDTIWYARAVQFICAGKKKSSAVKSIHILGGFLRWATAAGYLQTNPARLVKKPIMVDDRTERPAITKEEYERLLKVSEKSAYRFAIVMGWATGCSISDCCLLTWDSVDLEKMEISAVRWKEKAHGSRATIPFEPQSDLHQELLLRLPSAKSEEWPNRPKDGIFYVDGFLAQRYNRTLIPGGGSSAIWRPLRQLFDEAGIDKAKSFHSFRVAMATAIANSGTSTAIGCKIMGHSTPQMFTRYVRVTNSGLRDAMKSAQEARDGKESGL